MAQEDTSKPEADQSSEAAHDSEAEQPKPQSTEEFESLSGDEGKDKPAPPRTADDAMPKQPDTTEPVTDVKAEEVALAGDGQQPSVVVDVPEPAADLEGASSITSEGPMVADLAEDGDETNQPADPKAEQIATEKATMSMAIVVAILVALVLVGLSYAVFISSDDTNDSNNSESSQNIQTEEQSSEESQPQAPAEPLTNSQDLQAEFDDVQQALQNTDEESDFPEDELSDQALELQ